MSCSMQEKSLVSERSSVGYVASGKVVGKEDDDSDVNSNVNTSWSAIGLVSQASRKVFWSRLYLRLGCRPKKKDFTPGSTDSDNLPLTTLVGRNASHEN